MVLAQVSAPPVNPRRGQEEGTNASELAAIGAHLFGIVADARDAAEPPFWRDGGGERCPAACDSRSVDFPVEHAQRHAALHAVDEKAVPLAPGALSAASSENVRNLPSIAPGEECWTTFR